MSDSLGELADQPLLDLRVGRVGDLRVRRGRLLADRLAMAEELAAPLAVVGAHAARSAAAEGQVRVGAVPQRRVHADAARAGLFQYALGSRAGGREDVERQG